MKTMEPWLSFLTRWCVFVVCHSPAEYHKADEGALWFLAAESQTQQFHHSMSCDYFYFIAYFSVYFVSFNLNELASALQCLTLKALSAAQLHKSWKSRGKAFADVLFE